MLSPERQRRLEELRKKYPKQEPEQPQPKHHRAYLTISLRFDFQTMTQDEADRAAYYWMCRQYDIGDLLIRRYGKDGLRDISLIQAIRARQSEPTEEPTPTDDLCLLDIEDARDSDLSN